MSDRINNTADTKRHSRRRKNRKNHKAGVPLGITITIAAVCAAIAFSVAYIYAMKTFNSKVTDLSEKQAMFTKLYEIDSIVRENYSGTIDEEKLKDSLSSAYTIGTDKENVLYVSEAEYNPDKYSKDYKAFKISDGSYVLIKKSSLK